MFIRPRRLLALALSGLALLASALLAPAPLQAQTVEELSLDSLLSTPIRTAARYEQTAREVPASVTVVTAEEIEAAGHRTLAELLGGLRGFYVTDDHTREHLGTRGFGRILEHNNRVLFLLNGVQLNEAVYGAFDIGESNGIDLSLVDRVEVVRGPGSVLYGSGAMHAVVNVITKAPPATEGARAEVGLGGDGYGRASAWASHSGRGDWSAVGGVQAVRSDGRDLYFPEFDAPETNGGWAVGRNASNTYSAFTRLQKGGWSAQLNAATYMRGIPTADFGTRFNEEADNAGRFVRADLEHERAWGGRTQLTWRGFYSAGRSALRYSVRDAAYGLRPLFYKTNVHAQSLGGEVLLQRDLAANNRLVVGAQFVTTPGNRLGARMERPDGTPFHVLADGDVSFRFVSFYAQDEYQLRHDLSLTLGLRGDVYSHAGNALTPRAAVVYHPFEATTLKLLYGHAFRAPSGVEALYTGPVAYGINATPNPDLKPEQITTWELVWEQQIGPALSGVVSVYDYDVTRLIDAVIQLEPLKARFENRGRQKASGVEVGLEGEWGRALRASASYSYQRVRQEGIRFVFNAPAHLLRSSGHVRLARFDVAAEARYDGARRTLRGDRLDGRWLVDAKVTAPPLLGARASVEVRNLLGATYFTPGNAYQPQDRLLQPGRTLLARLAVRL